MFRYRFVRVLSEMYQIVRHRRIRAMGEKCPLKCSLFFHHIYFVEFMHCRECRANGFAG